MAHEDLHETTEYWLTRMQLDIYRHIMDYMERNHLNRTQLAEVLGVSKSYVTQLLNGDFDHRLSSLVEIALKTGYAPRIEFSRLPSWPEAWGAPPRRRHEALWLDFLSIGTALGWAVLFFCPVSGAEFGAFVGNCG